MSREAHVRFCEGPQVKFLRSTHPYIPTDEDWLYLAGVKDLFNGELVGHAMSERMSLPLVMQALFRAASAKRPPPGLILHSDRGSQYCARDYQKLLRQFGMKASMPQREAIHYATSRMWSCHSRKGDCWECEA